MPRKRKKQRSFRRDIEDARQWKWEFLRLNPEYRRQYAQIRPLLEETQQLENIEKKSNPEVG